MFRYFGAANVRIMNGGLQKWLKEGRPVFSGSCTNGEGLPALSSNQSDWTAKDPSLAVTEIAKVHEIAGKLFHGDKNWQITDARPPAAFSKELPGPTGVTANKITGSVNMPFGQLIDSETGCIKSQEELIQIFKNQGVDLTKQTVHSCGSGVTACIVQLAFDLCQGEKSAIYDGSWSEYSKHDEPDFNKKN